MREHLLRVREYLLQVTGSRRRSMGGLGKQTPRSVVAFPRFSLSVLPTHIHLDQEEFGLADAFEGDWLPGTVEPEKSVQATLVYMALMAGLVFYAGYLILSATVFRGNDLPISFHRDVTPEGKAFPLPYMTVCQPLIELVGEFEWEASCKIIVDNSVEVDCDLESSRIKTADNKDDCLVMKAPNGFEVGVMNPALELTMAVVSEDTTHSWVKFYLSKWKPENDVNFATEDRPFDFGWYKLRNSYTAKPTPQIALQKISTSSITGAELGPSDTQYSYSMFSTFHEQPRVTGDPPLHFFLRASPLGVDSIEVAASLDPWVLLGSIAGAYTYVLFIFGLFFGASSYAKRKRLEDK
ncbi:unnamed protein product, partial [Chrysoparadoxa australica]